MASVCGVSTCPLSPPTFLIPLLSPHLKNVFPSAPSPLSLFILPFLSPWVTPVYLDGLRDNERTKVCPAIQLPLI